MGENPSYFSGDEHPVEQVSWYDAVRFCNELSEMCGLERCYDEDTWECDFDGNGFRLPTEAEWEYACRAGTETRFYGGNDYNDDGFTSTALDHTAWYYANSGDESLHGHKWDRDEIEANNCRTHPVGRKEPNAWGLYDLHGNVWEWCNDWFDWSYYNVSPSSDPAGPPSGSERVERGGGYAGDAWGCRSAIRLENRPSITIRYLGFRVVRRP